VNDLQRVLSDVRAASPVLGRTPGAERDAMLGEMADALERRSGEILRENRLDVEAAKRAKAPPAAIDRLLLDEDRIAEMTAAIREVRSLPDPIGAIDGGRTPASGLRILRRRVPLGVVAVIFEGSPTVTADAVALCVKSGNAVVLLGGGIARRSNLILAEVLTGALIEADAPRWSLALLGDDPHETQRLVRADDVVDLLVARGGAELTAFLREHARVPVVHAATGRNHVYLHADADIEVAVRIAANAKAQRPAAGDTAETLLVHADAAAAVLPRIVERMTSHAVELRADRAALDVLGEAAEGLTEASDSDWGAERLGPVMAVRVVASLDEALAHIARHGSGHSEAIVTRSLDAASRFQDAVDAAAVCVNASTRFTDGREFGMGAQIGVSTQKLHARGPIGLAELTSYKYLVTGHGQVR
jgi:glutamate-5-semialdehyde dehydrogenase